MSMIPNSSSTVIIGTSHQRLLLIKKLSSSPAIPNRRPAVLSKLIVSSHCAINRAGPQGPMVLGLRLARPAHIRPLEVDSYETALTTPRVISTHSPTQLDCPMILFQYSLSLFTHAFQIHPRDFSLRQWPA